MKSHPTARPAAFPAFCGRLTQTLRRAGWGRMLLLLALFLPALATRADLVLEQRSPDTNAPHTTILTLHGDWMRMDQPNDHLSVIVNLKTHDSITLFTNIKKYLKRSGTEIHQQMEMTKRITGGTNQMDAAPAAAADTGHSEVINGTPAEIFTWTGANHYPETLWVDKKFPQFKTIKAELAKLDAYNESGPHRNAQPLLSQLPGMVIKSQHLVRGQTFTTVLVSVKLAPVSATLFEQPADYTSWKPIGKGAGS